MSEVAWFSAGAVVAAAVAWSIGRWRAGDENRRRMRSSIQVDADGIAAGRRAGTSQAVDRPAGDRPVGDRPIGDRPIGDRPIGEDAPGDGARHLVDERLVDERLADERLAAKNGRDAAAPVVDLQQFSDPGPTDDFDGERSDDHDTPHALSIDVTPPDDVDGPRVARSVAREIADVASAVEGSAFDLVEAAPEPERVPRAAERFLGAVQRLRDLHAKLVSYGTEASPSGGTADFREVVDGLKEELQHLRLGLELDTELPADLPVLACSPSIARNILLFACSAMFRSEPGATNLTISAERSLVENEPRLRIEMLLEWVVDPRDGAHPAPHESDVALAIEAARRLAEGHGGRIRMDRLADRVIRTSLRLPASVRPQESEPETVQPRTGALHVRAGAAAQQHDFGGALVVEADPDVRAMLARELRARGRAVFACADGSSARTFLEATPQRFELLIVDQEHRLEDRDALGETIRRLTPELKICVLGPAAQAAASDATAPAWPEVCRLQKPFGVHELRRALASVLDA